MFMVSFRLPDGVSASQAKDYVEDGLVHGRFHIEDNNKMKLLDIGTIKVQRKYITK